MTISGKAIVAGVMGWPVGHSRSPRLHNFWLARAGIDGAYVPFAVPPGRVEQALRALPALGFAGTNATIPHKEAAFAAVDETDAIARRIGAVNTVFVRDDGRLAGTNTDAFGFAEALRGRLGAWSGAGAAAVVLGAGGAARAIVAALQDEGASEIRLVNRTAARAEALRERFGPPVVAVGWDEREEALDGAAFLVNTTALGMEGGEALDIRLDALPGDAVVNDIVYTPLETALLASARARGLRAVDGLEMLLHQARPGFAGWYGFEPAVDDALRAHVAADLLG
ncbi:MAG: shikimate dehydrogenase [Defluviicoccus sp.]|nr:shikimate dehydrogenase [Defluviicoccus sp.]MDE0277391.1 shikimate dehydrogenase [Defluviicoccus sp.]